MEEKLADTNSAALAQEVEPNSSAHEEEVEPNSSAPEEEVELNSSSHEEEVEPNSSAHEVVVEPNSSAHEEEVELNSSAHEEEVEPKSSAPEEASEEPSSPLAEFAQAFLDAETLNKSDELSQQKDIPKVASAFKYAVSKWRPRKPIHTAAVVSIYALMFFVLMVNTVGMLIPGFNLLLITYWAYILLMDKKASCTSGRPKQWLKNSGLWHLVASYFPMAIHPTTALDPSRKYIFGYHPHGIISWGATVCFATNGAGFREKFPGIDLRLLTLKVNFLVPFWREFLLQLGICDVSKASIMNHLARGPGSAVMIVVGGAEESLCAETGTYHLNLKNRKGFVKLALREGASLVPVFSFGETDIFEVSGQSDGWVTRLQRLAKKKIGFTLPSFHGKGIWLAFGLLPFQTPMNIVVGRPVECPQVAEPSQEEIDLYHEKYMDEIFAIFNANKKVFGMTRREELRIH